MTTKKRDDLQAELRRIDRRLVGARTLIGAATLDEGPLEELRAETAELKQRRTEVEAAVEDLDRRAEAYRQERSAEQGTADLRRLQTVETRRKKAAVKIDAALQALETAYVAHERLTAEVDAVGSAYRAGARPDLRFRRAMVLSAMWHGCPELSSAIGLAFTPGNKRRPMSTHRTRLVTEGDK